MGKIFDNVNSMIMDAMKSSQVVKAETFRALKNEFLKAKTAKNAKPLDDDYEITIIKKMVKERKESANVYNDNGRKDLGDKELLEVSYLEPLLPEEVSDAQIEACFQQYMFYNSLDKIDQKTMGPAIGYIKKNLKNADGKKVSDIVKSHIS